MRGGNLGFVAGDLGAHEESTPVSATEAGEQQKNRRVEDKTTPTMQQPDWQKPHWANKLLSMKEDLPRPFLSPEWERPGKSCPKSE